MITRERLESKLHYDPDTGNFIWKDPNPMSGMKKGDIAGGLNGAGYILIRCCGERNLAHRLAWLYMTGQWPKDQIDHIDGNRSNNKFNNLRSVTRHENGKNKRIPKNAKYGIMGVRLFKGKWVVNIIVNSANKHYGTYDDFFEACCKRKSIENKYGFHENHGH